VDKVYPILPDYLDLVSKYYNGEANNIDFAGGSEKSRVAINRWVAGHTRDRIKELVPPNMITPMTRLVITNAIYFKGKWAVPFVTRLTEKETFHINSQSQVEAEMMRLPQTRLDYAEDEDAKVLRLDYVGPEIAMLIILPKENNIKALEDRLDDRQFLRWLGSVRLTDVMVIMPRFKFETEYQFGDDLASLGMATAFLPGKADFSGVTGNHDLSIGMVIHKAWVEVNEKGSEATAATAITMLNGGLAKFEKPKPKMFCADHPFIFFIYDRESKRILFMGRVMDPTKS
jgi:serpin B